MLNVISVYYSAEIVRKKKKLTRFQGQ